MELNEGEKMCEECAGAGEVIGDYPYSETCDECGGKGKVDWVSKAMGAIKQSDLFHVGNPVSIQKENDITFYQDKQEVLRICTNGDFFVKGAKAANDQKVYEGFVDFLKGAGFYK